MYIFGNNVFHCKQKQSWEEHVNDTIFFYKEIYRDGDIVLLEDSGRKLQLKLWYSKTPCVLEMSLDTDDFKLLYNNGIFSDTPCPKVYDIKKKTVSPKFIRGKKPIAIVALATPNMKSMTDVSFANHIHYAQKHDYNYLYYNDSLVDIKYVTWNKVYVLSDLLQSFKYVMWIDADAIFTNLETTIESIIDKNASKHLHVCDDIGGWRLNTGVMILQNHPWCVELLKTWTAMEKIPHNQGAEQQQLINLLHKQDNACIHWHVYNRRLFNAHPKDHQDGDYILHMMGLSGEERIKTFTAWNNKLGIQ